MIVQRMLRRKVSAVLGWPPKGDIPSAHFINFAFRLVSEMSAVFIFVNVILPYCKDNLFSKQKERRRVIFMILKTIVDLAGVCIDGDCTRDQEIA